jgi:hypothetical protein
MCLGHVLREGSSNPVEIVGNSDVAAERSCGLMGKPRHRSHSVSITIAPTAVCKKTKLSEYLENDNDPWAAFT